jgi:hypothetical protein
LTYLRSDAEVKSNQAPFSFFVFGILRAYNLLIRLSKMSSQHSVPIYLYRDPEWMESRQHSAFNQTRRSFLGLNVVVGDFSFSSLANWLLELTPDCGAGLWLAPFRGLPSTNERMSFDLVYLDANCRVIDLVESYPHSHLSPSSQPAASVLVLPAKVISSSGTRRGDLLVICAADELTNLPSPAGSSKSHIHAVASPVQGPARPIGRTQPLPDREQSQCDHPSEDEALFIAPRPIESTQVKGSVKITPPRQGFLARWLFPSPSPADRRKAPRKLIDNLVAFYWTGGSPTVNPVRDISSSGLYVVTTERWYPGTVIRMTLTKTKAVEETREISICVCAEVVRWGNDGVGLRFAVDNHGKKYRGQDQPVEGADRWQLDQFLKCVLHDDQQTRTTGSPCEALS